jgi:hypothetical protein
MSALNEESPICYKCVGDKELRRIINTDGVNKKCAICSVRRKCITLEELASLVDGVYREFYRPGREEPIFDDEGDGVRYEQEGDSPEDIIAEITGTDTDIGVAIRDILAEQNVRDIRDGDDPYYDSGFCYEPISLYPYQLHETWLAFCERIKHVRRFYDEDSKAMLSTLLGQIKDIPSTSSISTLVRTFKPGVSEFHLYRARRAKNADELKQIMTNPGMELGPPSGKFGYSGRMNPHGISVFYGGLKKDICISEVRPFVGEYVVVGEFQVLKELQMLDLSYFDKPPISGSMFEQGYRERAELRMFMRSFQNIISRPIQPHEESIEYIPTQAVAEYLANVLKFDGLIYLSAQTGQTSPDNVVMFSHAAHVAAESKPKKSTSIKRKSRSRLSKFALDSTLENWSIIPEPALQYVKGSAEIYRITSNNYNHEQLPEVVSSLDDAGLQRFVEAED